MTFVGCGGPFFRPVFGTDFGKAFLVDGRGFSEDFPLALLSGFRVEARGLLLTPPFWDGGGGDASLVEVDGEIVVRDAAGFLR